MCTVFRSYTKKVVKMAGFNALSFTYDGIPGEKYGLFICNFDSNTTEQVAENHTIRAIALNNSYKNIFYGYETPEPFTFEITLGSEKVIDAYVRSQITKWLVRRNGYKKLKIIQADMSSIFYNCVFTQINTVYIGNLAYAITLTAVCDSPYQYENPKTFNVNVNNNYNLTIKNTSDTLEYIYPKISFTMSAGGGNLSIINQDDNGREFKFTELSGSETINIDNQSKIITSSLGFYRLKNFNKQWLRLVNGVNSLKITGIASISIEMSVIKRIGA